MGYDNIIERMTDNVSAIDANIWISKHAPTDGVFIVYWTKESEKYYYSGNAPFSSKDEGCGIRYELQFAGGVELMEYLKVGGPMEK